MALLRRKLSDLVEIRTGVPFRDRIDHNPEGCFQVIQSRDISDNGSVQLDLVVRLSTLPTRNPHFLHTGDLIFQPRGNRYPVALVDFSVEDTVAAAPLIVLSCDRTRIVPAYLLLFFQLQSTQAWLRNEAVGTHIPQVQRAALSNLEIDLPSLNEQTLLGEYAQLRRREAVLATLLQQKGQQFLELAIRELAKKDRERESATDPEPVF